MLYSIALTDLRSEILAILNIKIRAKFNGMTHKVEFKDMSRGKKKTSLKDIT